jgi:hypothetical protein
VEQGEEREGREGGGTDEIGAVVLGLKGSRDGDLFAEGGKLVIGPAGCGPAGPWANGGPAGELCREASSLAVTPQVFI